ncbi:MAG: DUF3037 domain-containing protein [Candidatus Amulumruptor caecigallinarius]|nr:DUF3037 domain-containing protein [Candidatus Amulumruptor caecigallinarius]MCM1397158.1 DUF3037 domain-containing protein [Candidatus Amulumruptor caecigallinarius]MCM1453153.1 DUF3037 domain-containing protein [bacterium]
MPSQPGKHLYEYAVVRYVPQVEREEFVNVGLLMMCKRTGWLRVGIHCDPTRICALAPGTDVAALRGHLESFERHAAGGHGPIASLEPHERFRWLTAVRSACIQTSRPHPGITNDLDATFSRLWGELVANPSMNIKASPCEQ